MITLFKCLSFFFIFSSNLWAADLVSSWYALDAEKKITLNVETFLSSNCPHCHKAEAFFDSIAVDHPEYKIHRNIINEDIKALSLYNKLLKQEQVDDFAVPAVFFCDSRWLGFASAETTGADWLRAMQYCKQQIEKKGVLTPSTVQTLRQWSYANRLNGVMGGDSSLAHNIPLLALMDSLSPCAFFCLAGFLAVIFVEVNRKKQIIGGLLYILSLGIVHYYQQSYMGSFNQLLPWLRIPALLIGILALYLVFQLYKNRANTTLYYSMAFLLGLITTLYQQTCLLNWSYVFQQWLLLQKFSPLQSGLIQLGYQVLYLVPLLLVLIIYLCLLRINRFTLWQPSFFSRGLLFIVLIALCLIVYPTFLSHLMSSVFALFILIVCGRFLKVPR